MTRTGSIIRASTPEDYPAIAALLDRTLGERPYQQRLDLWEWRHDRNPARADAHPSFLVVEEKGRIVGVQGLIPLRVKAGNQLLNASCSCDLAVDPRARSAGLKLKLAALGKELSSIHFSTSMNEPANKITLALGGKEVPSGRRKWLLPLKASGLMMRGLSGKGREAGIVAMASRVIWKPVDWILAIMRSVKPAVRLKGTSIRDLPFFDVRFDNFWKQMAMEHEILVVRDSAYLSWRYTDYPFAGIQSFELRKGDEILGYSVIHLSSDEDHLRFAALLELVGSKREPHVLEQLLREAIRRSSEAGAHYMTARASTLEDEDLMRFHGFRPRDSHFSPVTYKNNSTIPPELFARSRNWYLSLGDGDGCHFF